MINMSHIKNEREDIFMFNVSCRSFEFANKLNNGYTIVENGPTVKAFPDAQLPEYQTRYAAGADFFCAEEVVVPSIWKQVFKKFTAGLWNAEVEDIKPTLVHTGVKANMEHDEYLEIVNRSSGPKKLGLVLANGVGIIDCDYYSNHDNDGEIMFAFYNFKFTDTVIKVGDRIGQGVFHKFLQPFDSSKGLRIKDSVRTGGFGSTNSEDADTKDVEKVDATPSNILNREDEKNECEPSE